ncbi:hypothetical protein MMC24_006518 [Lignoscripta atroalba]|nr:hypothetical protein [Lignoscripta atroalba]
MNKSNPPQLPTPEPSSSSNPITNQRSRKQVSLFFAGASFFALSSVITRRSLVRRYAATLPRFYQPSNRPPATPVNGAMEALEALNIATINVTSFLMMMAGGLLWAFDISSMDDMRRKIRGGLGVDGSGRSESDAEQEFEEWLAGVLQRKEEKRRKKGEAEEVERRNERGRPR